MKILRIISFVALVITSVISFDLLVNYLENLVPEMNDGLGAHCIILPTNLYFGDTLWSIERFYNGFITSSLITLSVFIENVVLTIVHIVKK